MRLDRFLFLAMFMVPLQFIILVLRMHNHETPSKRMIFRRQNSFNSTGPYLDMARQQLDRLETSYGILQEELQRSKSHGHAFQRLEGIQSRIDKLLRDLDDLQSTPQAKMSSNTTEENMKPELGKIYIAIQLLRKRLSSMVERKNESSTGMFPTYGDDSKFNVTSIEKSNAKAEAKRGVLICKGKRIDSEVIYWKVVPGDADYESPYRRKNELAKKFLTFKYDPSGYNNLRMSFESLAVLAHAMGRVFVIPPDDQEESEKNINYKNYTRDLGINDIFNMELLRSHKGFSTLTMDEFIEKEAKPGHIKNIRPPRFERSLRGDALWKYLISVADVSYGWNTKFFVFDDHDGEIQISEENSPPGPMLDRLHAFFGQDENGRAIVNYNKVFLEYF